MKFGEHLQTGSHPPWRHQYLNYDELKRMIRILARDEGRFMQPAGVDVGKTAGGFSLTVPPPTNAAAQPRHAQVPPPPNLGTQPRPSQLHHHADADSDDEVVSDDPEVTHEAFFELLEKDMAKVHNFTDERINETRKRLRKVEKQLNSGLTSKGQPIEANVQLRQEVDQIGEDFLRLEKYVNLNYTGFAKILKKHDRWLTNPCRSFYLQRLQSQHWTQGDYSDVLVLMSQIYGFFRNDKQAEASATEKQEFVRTTTKYWVRDQHISELKWRVLQELPVLLQTKMGTKSDSQLINSVYLDNASMELYKGRLDKTPGAIAIRFRWYGSGEPATVFVERKTHRESWAREVSVKERFTVEAAEIPSLLNGQFEKEKHIQELRKKNKSEKEIDDWSILVTEVCQAINSKQLVPTLRTQYMRTAFQVPHDATVRISLDTNLCMLTETGRLGFQDRWFRDPEKPVPPTEITRFPHAVLEVKLQLKDEESKPEWVTKLLQAGIADEVHKFSKFIHGCAVLLRHEVGAMPYWIDDPSISDSIIASGSGELINESKPSQYGDIHQTRRQNDEKRWGAPLPRRDSGNPLPSQAGKVRAAQARYYDDYYYDEDHPGCFERMCGSCCMWTMAPDVLGHISAQKIEPKLFFANERTFIHWLNMAVTISSLGAAVLAFAPEDTLSELYGIILLPVSLIFAIYALKTYVYRSAKIRTREPTRWDDPMGPILLGSIFTLALIAQFCIKLVHLISQA